MIRFHLCIIFIVSTFLTANLSYGQDITYMGLGERRDGYHTELLSEILNNFPNKKYHVNRYADDLPRPRSFNYLAENIQIDIVIAYASEERNAEYLAVNIPIMKGLNGWRTSVVHVDNVDMFKKNYTLDDLKKYVPGQFHTWTDNKILLKNGITTARGANFDGLYYMLDKKRFDYFPRSILVIDQEMEEFKEIKKLNISLEPHTLIKYPTAFVFYVNKENTELAQDLNDGFETIIASGKFNEIFNKHFGAIINRIRNEKRHVFTLKNPLLPDTVPLDRSEIWLTY